MSNVAYVLIPGLWDQKLLFGWYYHLLTRLWKLQGMHAVVCEMRWVSSEPFEKKLERLRHCVEREHRAGREVVLVGVSAGGPMSIIGMSEWGSAVLGAVSISGLLALTGDERRNPLYTKTSWYQAADRAERFEHRLSAQQRKSILTLGGTEDDLIAPPQEHVPGSKQRRVKGKYHLPTVVQITLFYSFVIRRFVRSLKK